MTFLPDGRLLVTERGGNLFLVSTAGSRAQVTGVPAVVASGQLGLHDIALDPGFATVAGRDLDYATLREKHAGASVPVTLHSDTSCSGLRLFCPLLQRLHTAS